MRSAISIRIILVIFSCSLLTVHGSLAFAQAPPSPDAKIQLGRLSFGFVTGYYQPDLSTLNGVINTPTQSILEDPNFLLPGNPNFTVQQKSIVAGEMGGAPMVGLEAQWDLSPSFAVRLTGGVWRGEREASDIIVTFLRSNLPQIQAPRSARYNLILDQFFLDWRYYFINDPKRGRLSLDLGILGMTVGFLTMDSIVRVVDPAAPGGAFASISSTEAQGIAYTSRYGLTGEYFFSKKFALGISTHYVLGRMTGLEVKRHFPSGFPQIPIPEPLSLTAGTPTPQPEPQPVPGENVSFATAVTQGNQTLKGRPQDLVLELNGLEVSGYLRFYF